MKPLVFVKRKPVDPEELYGYEDDDDDGDDEKMKKGDEKKTKKLVGGHQG